MYPDPCHPGQYFDPHYGGQYPAHQLEGFSYSHSDPYGAAMPAMSTQIDFLSLHGGRNAPDSPQEIGRHHYQLV